MTTLFADLDMARRLEQAEAYAAETYARELAQQRPDIQVAIEEVGGGRAVFAGAGSHLSEAKGVGLHGPVSETDLDRMEAVFFRRGEPSRVVVCPLADPAFIEALARRGYRLTGFENILIRPLAGDTPEAASPPGIEVQPVDRETAGLYANVVAPNFVEPGEPVADIVEMMATMIGLEHASAFLAWIDAVPVGGGAVFIRERLALLAGAATQPAYRNRGVHAALHLARLDLARRAGCDVAAQGAQPGSTSQRNAERRGFHVAYTRAFLVRDHV